MLVRLESLSEQHRQLEAEYQAVADRCSVWLRAMEHLDSIEARCQRVAANLDTLTFEDRRLALDAPGVTVFLWGTDSPRYKIETSVLFRDPVPYEPRYREQAPA